MKEFTIKLVIAFILYGAVSIIATIIHESGHLFFAHVNGANELGFDFDFFAASYANWSGERTILTTLGGVIATVVFGIPFGFILFRVHSNFYLKISAFLLAMVLISNEFLYLAISAIIEWGDGFTLVHNHHFHRMILVLGCLIIGIASGLVYMQNIHQMLLSQGYTRKAKLMFILLFFFIIIAFRGFSDSFFVYTQDCILLINLLAAIIVIIFLTLRHTNMLRAEAN